MKELGQTIIIDRDRGRFRTGAETHALKLQLVGGGGGGAGGAIDVGGPGGEAGDLLIAHVAVKPNADYSWRRGAPGEGRSGIQGGQRGGDTVFEVGDLVIIARGGRGGRASGLFRAHPTPGASGSPGCLVIDELDEMPPKEEIGPKVGGIMLLEHDTGVTS